MTEPENRSTIEKPVVSEASALNPSCGFSSRANLSHADRPAGLIVLLGWAFAMNAWRPFSSRFRQHEAERRLLLCALRPLASARLPSANLKYGKETAHWSWPALLSGLAALRWSSISPAIRWAWMKCFSRIFPARPSRRATGRMAPITALAFVLCGVALVFLARGTRGAVIAHTCTLAALFGRAPALIGYLFNAQAFVTIFSLTGMAVHTIAGFMLLGSGHSLRPSEKRTHEGLLAQNSEGLSRGD